MLHIFHPRASRDAQKIEKDYTRISEELGNRFWKELSEAIDEVFAHPSRQHFDLSGYRRRNLKKFPFHILFEERLDSIRIMVIRHDNRKPSYGIRRR